LSHVKNSQKQLKASLKLYVFSFRLKTSGEGQMRMLCGSLIVPACWYEKARSANLVRSLGIL